MHFNHISKKDKSNLPEIQTPPDQSEEQPCEQQPLFPAVTPALGKHAIHCLTVVGQIEGHYVLSPQNKTTKYELLIPQLVAVEESPDVEGLIIILNTVGGDVEAGLALSELIAGMKKPTVSLVLGGGHSIGVPLAVSAKRSFIVPSASMTIHPVRMNGLVLGVSQTLDTLLRMQDRVTDFVASHSSVTKDRFNQLMTASGQMVSDIGTLLSGEQAVKEGIIDELGGLKDALEYLYELIEK